ncbi:hypothetical protein ANANG_G00315490, partial [Anguilla anguilla]
PFLVLEPNSVSATCSVSCVCRSALIASSIFFFFFFTAGFLLVWSARSVGFKLPAFSTICGLPNHQRLQLPQQYKNQCSESQNQLTENAFICTKCWGKGKGEQKEQKLLPGRGISLPLLGESNPPGKTSTQWLGA